MEFARKSNLLEGRSGGKLHCSPRPTVARDAFRSYKDWVLSDLLERQFVFITGKGGVGKSTVGALLALEAAAAGKSVLVVVPQGSPAHDALWGRPIPADPGPVAPGVEATLADSESAMREYSRQILGSQRLVDLLFHSKVARGFLTGIPGLSDWAILGKAWAYTPSSDFPLPAGQHTYDLVILDAPASGDGTKMLRIPDIILDMGATGRIKNDAAKCREMLRDPQKTALVLVSLAEELVVQETEENLELIRQELGIPLGPVFVNQIQDPTFTPDEISLLLDDTTPMKGTDLTVELLTLAKKVAASEQRQRGHLARLLNWNLPVIQLPKISSEFSGLSALEQLQMALAGER